MDGSETVVERAAALRTTPLQIEFHMRNKADGFRVQWSMPKSAPRGSVASFVTKPAVVGYGITPDPVREVSYDSAFAAVGISIKEPWRVLEPSRLHRRGWRRLHPPQDAAQHDR